MAQRDSQTLKLPDGRVLGFAEYGSPTGKPVFFFHGFPSSRLEVSRVRSSPSEARRGRTRPRSTYILTNEQIAHISLQNKAAGIFELIQRQDLRIIAPERPGFGLSTFNPRHRITDWPQDVRALAAHLGLSRFAILGGSGGAPYALACARALPAETISAVGLMAPAGPWKEAGIAGVPLSARITAFMAYYWPGTLRVVTAGVVGLSRWLVTTGLVSQAIDRWLEKISVEKGGERKTPIPSTITSTTSQPNPSPAATAASIKGKREALLRFAFETFRQGTAPMVRESQPLTWEGWGLPLEEVKYDKIVIWHGTEDGQSPIRMVRYLAQHLPHCELREFEGETHFTLVKHLGHILEELVPEERERDRASMRVGEGSGRRPRV